MIFILNGGELPLAQQISSNIERWGTSWLHFRICVVPQWLPVECQKSSGTRTTDLLCLAVESGFSCFSVAAVCWFVTCHVVQPFLKVGGSWLGVVLFNDPYWDGTEGKFTRNRQEWESVRSVKCSGSSLSTTPLWNQKTPAKNQVGTGRGRSVYMGLESKRSPISSRGG